MASLSDGPKRSAGTLRRGTMRVYPTRSILGICALAMLAASLAVISTGSDAFAQQSAPSGWSAAAVPAGTGELYGVACPSATSCVAVGASSTSSTNAGDAIYSTDGGQSWSTSQLPSGTGGLDYVACPTPSFCMAVGASNSSAPGALALSSTDGGSSWSDLPVPAQDGVLYSVACGSAQDCWAGGTGTIVATDNGGKTWSTEQVGSSGNPSMIVTGLSFVNDSDGWATGYDPCGSAYATSCPSFILSTTDGGATWATQEFSDGGSSENLGSLFSISCSTAIACEVLGGSDTGAVVAGTTDGGATWSVQNLPSSPQEALMGAGTIDCITGTQDCFVDGWTFGTAGADQPYTNASSVVLATTDAGTTWVPQATSTAVAAGYAIACFSEDSCVAVGLSSAYSSGPVQGAAELTSNGGVLPNVYGISPSSGPISGGETVTITGSYLNGATAVTFGSTPAASINVVSSSEITAEVPPAAGAGVVNVLVTTPAGTSFAYDSSANQTVGPDGYDYVVAGAYNPVTPYRLCDTRSGNATPCEGLDYSNGGNLCLSVAGTNPVGESSGGVPSSGVEAAVMNVTVVDSSPVEPGVDRGGYLTVYPAGLAVPLSSNLNYAPGATSANLVEVPLGTGGSACFYDSLSGTAVALVVDVEGWVSSSSSGEGFQPLEPTRICDTRPGNPSDLSGAAAQCNGANDSGRALGPGSTLSVSVAGVGGVPSTAGAVVANVTVADTTSGGYLTIWPAGQPQPLASNLNWEPGQIVANRVTVPIGSNGEIDIYNSSGSTDVIVDVAGYFISGSGLLFTPSSPTRICDTRPGNPSDLSGAAAQCNGANDSGRALGPGSTLSVSVAGVGGVPSTAGAVVANVTVADTTAASYLTVFPTGSARPTASDINWAPGEIVPNLVVVELGSSGSMDVYNYAGSTDVIVDLSGWYG